MTQVSYSSDLVMTSSWWVSTPQSTVKKVVDTYNDLVVQAILRGESVNYLSLVVLKGEKQVESLPLGYHFYEVAKQLNMELSTVEFILSRYEEIIKNHLLLKNIVVVYGIVRLTPSSSGKVSVKTSSRFGRSGISVRAKVSPFWNYEVGLLTSS